MASFIASLNKGHHSLLAFFLVIECPWGGKVGGREEGKEKGEEEGEIKGIKVTQDLFDCCEAAAGKIPGDPQKNIGTCMDDPEFAKKYGCAPKDDDPKTEERLRTAMADEAKTKRK